MRRGLGKKEKKKNIVCFKGGGKETSCRHRREEEEEESFRGSFGRRRKGKKSSISFPLRVEKRGLFGPERRERETFSRHWKKKKKESGLPVLFGHESI